MVCYSRKGSETIFYWNAGHYHTSTWPRNCINYGTHLISICGNFGFPQNFHTRKLGGVSLFYAVLGIKLSQPVILKCTARERKFSINNFLSKCDQIRRKVRNWSHLLKKSLMENFIFRTVVEVVYLASTKHVQFQTISRLVHFNWSKICKKIF